MIDEANVPGELVQVTRRVGGGPLPYIGGAWKAEPAVGVDVDGVRVEPDPRSYDRGCVSRRLPSGVVRVDATRREAAHATAHAHDKAVDEQKTRKDHSQHDSDHCFSSRLPADEEATVAEADPYGFDCGAAGRSALLRAHDWLVLLGRGGSCRASA